MDKIQQTVATEAKPVWTAPVIDVVPAKATAVGGATQNDGVGTSS
ncbi:hypothetical protein ACVWZA_001806 [Sphingomonas sp. UYAg733]